MKIEPSFFPKVALVRQKLISAPVTDVSAAADRALQSLQLVHRVKAKQTVAVAVGSRGISSLDAVVYGCIRFLKQVGLTPVIVPAMGSHGGATPEGQVKVLADLGITEEAMGVSIEADMAVRSVGSLPGGVRIYTSSRALEADHIVVVNRVKRHTKFRAPIESGLCKMLTIGLGKAEGAGEFHRRAVQQKFGIIEDAAGILLERGKVLFGLALLEDGHGMLARIEAVLPENMISTEKRLLKEATAMMATIPLDPVDILVVDQFGKDISGIGMDSNVTGRHRDISGDFCMAPHVKRIFVRELSPSSDGNGNGIGLADVTTTRLVKGLDLEKTYKNAITAISPEKAAIPIHFDSDGEALVVCARTCGLDNPAQARIVRIRDTKRLELLQVSEAFTGEVAANPSLEQVTAWEEMRFDTHGNLLPMSAG